MNKVILLAMSLIFLRPTFGVGKIESINLYSTPEVTQRIQLNVQEVCKEQTLYCQVTKQNIRKRPSTDSEKLGFFTQNAPITAYMQMGEWWLIQYEDQLAYVHADYVGQEQVVIPSYTDRELSILAHIIAGEAQYCEDIEQRYVGSVLLNRVKDPHFPNTIEEVAFQPGQYTCRMDLTPTEANWANAKWLLENGSILPEGVIFQARRPLGPVYLQTRWHYYCFYP